MTDHTPEPSFTDLVLRAVAVVGLVAILLVGAWGIIQLAFYIPTLFGSRDSSETPTTVVQTSPSSTVAAPAPESLALVAPGVIGSGQPFLLVWNHQNETGNYAYQVSYGCATNVSLKALVPTGAYQSVLCNTPFNFTGATSSLPIILSVSGQKQDTVAITVAAKRLSDGAATAVASSTTTVLPATNTQTKTVAAVATKTAITTSPKTARTLFGLSDFQTTINSVTPSQIVTGQVHYSAVFTIANVGTNVTPANWAFQASVPVNGGYTYNSPMQQKLYPGDKIVYTLGFDVPTNNNQYFAVHQGAFSVTADPQNIALEPNENNNTASVSVSI